MEPNHRTTRPADEAWVPQVCTLPTVDRPLRVAEFDALFADAVTGVEVTGPARIRMRLRPEASVAARAATLAVRETECCSFFAFTLTATGGDLALDVAADEKYAGVVQALSVRAGSRLPGGRP
jgi:hypothetical protein